MRAALELGTVADMTTPLTDLITKTLEGRMLLSHPFYRRWEAGELLDGELTSYAEQYRYFEAYLPVFLGELAEQLPAGIARDAVADNLADEAGSPTHLELFDDFAAHYGAGDAAISPAMRALLDTYRRLLTLCPTIAVAGLLAYECQGAAIADSKADGLKRHYGAPAGATAFWSTHGWIEEDHAAWTEAGLVSLHPSDGDVALGISVIANAWWDFLTERDALVGAA